MADKKISALTASSTPLAGTEVLPIVQSGTTVKVAVSDLTTGRAVATGNLTTTGIATISSNTAIGTATPRTSANKVLLTMDATWGGQVDIGVSGTSHAQFGTDNYDTGASCRIQSQDSIVFKMNGGTATNIYMESGNLRPSVAGKGVNFTANSAAAGMTSQLLNWYEEGTWTPNQGAGLTVVGAFSSTGVYTRIGRQVTVTGQITGATSVNTSGSGIVCTNLPFTVGTNSNSVGAMTNTATNNTYVYVNPGSTTMYSSTAAGASGSLFFTVTYSI